MNILNENYRAKLKFLAEHAERAGGRVGYEKLFNIKDDNIALFLATHTKLNKQSNGIRFIVDWGYLESITPDKVDEHGLAVSFYGANGKPDSKTFYGQACKVVDNLEAPRETRKKSWPYQELPNDSTELPADFKEPEPKLTLEELVVYTYETYGLIMHKSKLLEKIKARREGKDLSEVEALKAVKVHLDKLGAGSLSILAKAINDKLQRGLQKLMFADRPDSFTQATIELYKQMTRIQLSNGTQLNQERFNLLTLFGADIVYERSEQVYDGEQDMGYDKTYEVGKDCMVDLFLSGEYKQEDRCNLRFHTITPVARVFGKKVSSLEYIPGKLLREVRFPKHYNGTYLGRLKHYVTMSYNLLEKEQQAYVKDFITSVDNYRYYHLTLSKNTPPEINWHAIAISIYINEGFLISPYTLQYLVVKLKLEVPSIDTIIDSPKLEQKDPIIQDTSYDLD